MMSYGLYIGCKLRSPSLLVQDNGLFSSGVGLLPLGGSVSAVPSFQLHPVSLATPIHQLRIAHNRLGNPQRVLIIRRLNDF